MKNYLIVLLLLAQAIAANGQPAKYSGRSWLGFKYYTFADFRRDVIASKATTVSDGIRVLPAEFKNNFTLVRYGNAIQTSSAEYPRAIMFGETGHLIASFNGRSDEMGYDSIETAEFDDSTKRIFYRSILFKNEPLDGVLSGSSQIFRKNEIAYEDNNVIVTKRNPYICITCHVNSTLSMEMEMGPTHKLLARYIWSRPHQWSAAYGEHDNREGDEFLKMKATFVKHPRYRQLFENEDHASGVYPYYSEARGRQYSLMPNERLADLLAHHYSMQMAKGLQSNTEFLDRIRAEIRAHCNGLSGHELLVDDMRRYGFQFESPALELDLSHLGDVPDYVDRDSTSLGNDIAIAAISMNSAENSRFAKQAATEGDELGAQQLYYGVSLRNLEIKQTLRPQYENEILKRYCAEKSH